MKITKILVYHTDLPLVDGSYDYGDGKSVDKYDSTVVAIHTDREHIVGYGEVVPLGPSYLASYARGVRSGLNEVAPHLIGKDPTKIGAINDLMDFHLKGHPYVKSPIDMACWDILGKVSKLPVSTLLGGRRQDSIVLYRAIPQRSAKDMAHLVLKYKKQGYTRFQLKLGSGVHEDIERIQKCLDILDSSDILIGDANTAWLPHEAVRVAAKFQYHSSLYIEQPCASLQECISVRRMISLPFVIDECVDSVQSLLEVWKEKAADVVNIKISKLGGISKAKQAIDLCVQMGLAMTIEDTWGGDITTAAILHLASTVPPKFQFSTTDFNSYNTLPTGVFGYPKPVVKNGRAELPSGDGLGVTPEWDVLGKPVLTFH